jgi:hypothetical protein
MKEVTNKQLADMTLSELATMQSDLGYAIDAINGIESIKTDA